MAPLYYRTPLTLTNSCLLFLLLNFPLLPFLPLLHLPPNSSQWLIIIIIIIIIKLDFSIAISDRQMDSLEGGHRRSTSARCCNACYAWASFLIWTAIIFLLIFGISFFAFVRSNLPEIKVHRLDVCKLNVTEPQNKKHDKQITIDVQVMVNMTNNNRKMTLVYGTLDVETRIEGISLPDVHVDGFRQETMTTNDLTIHPKGKRSRVDVDHVKQVKMNADHRELVLDVTVKGKIQFWYKGRVMSNLHLKASCEGVEQSQIDQAVAHECNVKLQFLR